MERAINNSLFPKMKKHFNSGKNNGNYKQGRYVKKRELVKMANGDWVIFNKYYPLEEIK